MFTRFMHSFVMSLLLFISVVAPAQTITTIAGTGVAGFSGDGGSALSADLFSPVLVTLDASGNIFFADNRNHRIRKIDAVTGVITTIAGSGPVGPGPGGFGGDGGLATNAVLNFPNKVTFDLAGNLFVADNANHRIRRIDAITGAITTIAGTGVAGFSGDGGLATNAELFGPVSVLIQSNGDILITDQRNHRIRKIDAVSNIITTIAGSGPTGPGPGSFNGDGGLATNALLFHPGDMIFDAQGNLLFTDMSNNRIRKIDVATGIITTIAGTGPSDVSGGAFGGDGGLALNAQFFFPTALARDAIGNLFVTDHFNNRVRMINTAGIITTVAGSGPTGIGVGGFGGDGGPTTSAFLHQPNGVAIDALGRLLIADQENQRIRIVPLNQPPNCSNATIANRSAGANCQATISGAEVTGVIDPDNDDLTITVNPTTLSLGANSVTVTADDGNGGTCSTSITVNVIDNNAPTLIVNSTPITLWPPNHQYVTINVSQFVTSVSDNCNSSISVNDVVITQVSSDEPEDAQGGGDGNTNNDIVITSCSTVDLRAERQGSGNGRVYTIHLQVSDGNDNTATATCQVHVPKSQNGKPAVDDGTAAGYIVDGNCSSATKLSSNFSKPMMILEGYALEQNYPNPFNPITEITFAIPEPAEVSLSIYNIHGQLVRRLVSGHYAAGRYSVKWNATNGDNVPVTSGLYLYMLKAGNFIAQRRLVLMK